MVTKIFEDIKTVEKKLSQLEKNNDVPLTICQLEFEEECRRSDIRIEPVYGEVDQDKNEPKSAFLDMTEVKIGECTESSCKKPARDEQHSLPSANIR